MPIFFECFILAVRIGGYFSKQNFKFEKLPKNKYSSNTCTKDIIKERTTNFHIKLFNLCLLIKLRQQGLLQQPGQAKQITKQNHHKFLPINIHTKIQLLYQAKLGIYIKILRPLTQNTNLTECRKRQLKQLNKLMVLNYYFAKCNQLKADTLDLAPIRPKVMKQELFAINKNNEFK